MQKTTKTRSGHSALPLPAMTISGLMFRVVDLNLFLTVLYLISLQPSCMDSATQSACHRREYPEES